MAVSSDPLEVGSPSASAPAPLKRRRRGGDAVEEAEERMRQVLARELHDQVAQGLTAMLIQLETLRRADADSASLLRELTELQADARQILAGVRNLLYDLRGQGGAGPASDLLAAIRQALERFQSRSGTACELVVAEGWPEAVAPQTAHHLYRIIHEAVENAVRHGRATRIVVELQAVDTTCLVAVVRDDGGGISEAGANMPGFGVVGMRERSRLLGGDLSIVSSTNGTIVSATVPVGLAG